VDLVTLEARAAEDRRAEAEGRKPNYKNLDVSAAPIDQVETHSYEITSPDPVDNSSGNFDPADAFDAVALEEYEATKAAELEASQGPEPEDDDSKNDDPLKDL